MGEFFQKKTLEEKKRDLEEKKKNLMNRERLSSQRKLLDVGKLALKAKITHIDADLLFGAFIEISANERNSEHLTKWRENSKKMQKEINGVRIAISFKQPPSLEVKNHLKQLNFRWNRFRGEYYGFGEKSIVSDSLNGVECKIEVIE